MARWFDVLRLRLRSLFRSRDVEDELGRELRAHLDQEIDANIAAGMTAADARRTALLAFGPVAGVEEACRDTRRVSVVQNVWRDGRYALRALRRQPMLLVAATASIGLGVGVTLTVFALANALLLSVPSAARPDELVHIRTGNGSHVSYAAWQGLEESGVLAGVTGYQIEASVNWQGPDRTVTLTPLLVTGNFFDVVGVPVALGRGFTMAEARLERSPRLVVVSHGFWLRQMGADPDALGRTLTLNGEAYTIQGVLPAGLRSFPGYGLVPDVYLPISRALMPHVDQPRTPAVMLVGRLRTGQDLDQGRAAVATVVGRLGEQFGDDELGHLTDFSSVGGISQARDFEAVGAFFVLLLVVAGLVLAIACANVAGLLLARGTTRGREIALRVALGASRRRLVQQLLTEGGLLAGFGTVAGVIFTIAAGRLLTLVSLPLPVPLEIRLAFDGRLALLGFGLVGVSTLLCGLAPAIRATRPTLTPALKQDETRYGHRRFTTRNLLVVGQVAVSLVLLVTALIFLRNLGQAASLDPGFDVDRVAVAEITFVEGRQGSAAAPTVERIIDRVRAVPGIETAAFAAGVPLTLSSGGTRGTEIAVEGREGTMHVEYKAGLIGPGYFDAMGIEILAGRDFTSGDRLGAPPVLIVNREFARRYLDGERAVGRRLTEAHRGAGQPTEVIGVVADGKYVSLGEAHEPALYRPVLQRDTVPRFTHAIVRTLLAPDAITAAVAEAVRQVDGSAAVSVESMESALAFAFLPSRIGAVLLGFLGAAGTLLAMVGLYGVIAFAVSRRTSEIGIRMTLGASRPQVLGLVLRDSGLLVGLGLVCGLAVALLLTQPLAAFLVAGLSPLDPLSFVGTTILLILVSLVAISSPARRALRVEPSVALRND